MTEKQASKVGVHTLITADKFVGKCETGHETTLLEPKNRSKRSREENTLNCGEGDKTLAKGRLPIRDPAHGPVSFTLDTGYSLDGIEQVITLGGVLDVCVDEKGVRFRMNVLHHDLETVEAPCFGGLDFIGEPLNEVLVDDSVRSGEKGEDVGDKVTFIIVEFVGPIVKILREVHLFGCPE